MSYLILDIETVPDFTVWQPPKVEEPVPEPLPADVTPINGKPARKPRAKKPKEPKEPKDVFPPLYAHRPIAIGYGLFDDDLKLQYIGCAGHDDEPKLLSEFSGWLATLPATLVTWRGKAFDVPVLEMRSLRHGLTVKWNTSNHRKKYDEDAHLDLADAITNYMPRTNGYSLDTFTQLIGLGGKNGVDGSLVKGMYEKGEIAKIHGYCLCDIGRTAFMLLRYLLLRGRIDVNKYREAATALFQECLAKQLTGVTFGADPTRLLLQTEVPAAAVSA